MPRGRCASAGRGAGTPGSKSRGIDWTAASKHWAFQPIRQPGRPPVKDAAWPRSPIDPFVLARLEAAGLTPSPPADRRTLIRRAYFDLIGLPPTPRRSRRSSATAPTDAFARVVDRLLASPRYGERWGRHWLDVARYADTKDGVLMFGDDRVRPYAYTYRDYVIRAFNDDLPFDRFVLEQLAADQLEPKDEPWRLAAMGFLTLGRMFDNNIHDILDDRIDVVTRGLLGLTVACARCHDHKYDPIPHRRLLLALRRLRQQRAAPGAAAHRAPGRAARLRRVREAGGGQAGRAAAVPRRPVRDAAQETARQRVGDYLVRAATDRARPAGDGHLLPLARARGPAARRSWPAGAAFLRQRADRRRPGLRPLARPDEARRRRLRRRGEHRPGPMVDPARGDPPGTAQPAGRRGARPRLAQGQGRRARASTASCSAASTRSRRRPAGEPRQPAEADKATPADPRDRRPARTAPPTSPRSQTWSYMSRSEKDAFGGKQVELDRMAVKAAGNAAAAGDGAERRRRAVRPARLRPRQSRPAGRARPAAVPPRPGRRAAAPFTHGSGRLDLARAITAADNPLTGRVIVNRVWMHHFGEPLVHNAITLTLTNRSANPFANVKVEEVNGIRSFDPISSLSSGGTCDEKIHVNFNGRADPIKANILLNNGQKIPVKIVPVIGELVRPELTSNAEFESRQSNALSSFVCCAVRRLLLRVCVPACVCACGLLPQRNWVVCLKLQ